MENEKITAVLNEVMVNKLESIAFDIKYYINTNASIAQSLDEESKMLSSLWMMKKLMN